MMKDSEWGAVAYFTSAIGRIPYVNPTQANGYAGPTQSSANKEVGASDVYFWNTEYGARASTTHNVYGIYDMAGGKHEFVAAVKNTAVASQITNLKNADAKYVDKYTTDYPPVESGNIGWDSDTKGTIWGDPPAFTRGGYRGGDGQGIFNGYKSPTVSNGVTTSSYTFRMALFGQAI